MSKDEYQKRLLQIVNMFKHETEKLEAESGIETGFLIEAFVHGLVKYTQEIVGPKFKVSVEKIS